MKHLYISNRPVDSIDDLKALIDSVRGAKVEDPLSVELIDNFVDGNIEAFFRVIGEQDLAEKVSKIDTTIDSYSQLRQKLIETILNIQDDNRFNPLQYLEVVRSVVEDNKALLEVKVRKKAIEQIDIEIKAPEIQKKETKKVFVKDYHHGEIITLEMDVPALKKEYDVVFSVGDRVVEKRTIEKIDPLQYVRVKKAGVFDNKALLEVEVVKKTTESIDIGIKAPWIIKTVTKEVKCYSLGGIATLEMDVPELGLEYDVIFTVDDKVVNKEEVGKNRTFSVGGVDFNMIKVEGGEMGTYYIGETLVTQALWKSVIKENCNRYLDKDPSRFKSPSRPVECVSWNDCNDFIEELNKILAPRLPKGYSFALPTEAQWEYAAKGGKKSRGCQYSGCDKEEELKNYAWYAENSNNITHDVKRREPNELKIYDMSGNVWEWCEDICGGVGRLLRGGSWKLYAEYCRVDGRIYHYPYYFHNTIGFRLALVQKGY